MCFTFGDMEAPLTRVCNKCGEEKPLEEFVKDKNRKYGYGYRCKPCEIERQRKWREDNPERNREKRIKYNKAHPGRAKEQACKWNKAHPGRTTEYSRNYRENNLEKERERIREYFRNSPEKATRNRAIRYFRRKGIPYNELSEEFIQYKIAHIQLTRKIKEHETS